MGNITINKGNLILSQPSLLDINFHRSVIFICDHDDEKGSFGLVINKSIQRDIDVTKEILLLDKELFIGGPVEQQTLHFIHRIPELENSISLENGYYWGGDFEMLKIMNLQGKITPSNCRFIIGYSGWAKQQLKNELLENSWIVSNKVPEKLFEVNPKNMWKYILQEMGPKYKLFINYPSNPRMN